MFAREEKDILLFLRKVLLNIALVAASPFLMLAFLFFLLEKPALWSLVLLAVAALILAVAGVLWLVVRSRIRAVREKAEWVASTIPPPRGPF